MRRSLLAVLALLCSAQVAPARQQATKELTVVGRLTPTTEAGGWLVVADYGKYLLTNANQFRRQPWFREGAAVEATGRVRDDVMSIHMEGVPFQARTIRARGGARKNDTQSSDPQTGPPPPAGPPPPERAGLVRVLVTGEAV